MFNLNDIRIPQLVELEHRLRCERVPSARNGKFGKTVFHPDGKNPGNVGSLLQASSCRPASRIIASTGTL